MRRALEAVGPEAGPAQPLDHDHERIAADAELRRFAERTVVFEDRLDARGFVMVDLTNLPIIRLPRNQLGLQEARRVAVVMWRL